MNPPGLRHRAGAAARRIAVFAIGALLPHAQSALERGLVEVAAAGAAPLALRAAAWVLVLGPGAALVAAMQRRSGHGPEALGVATAAALAATGALAALAVPFWAYDLPIGLGAARLLGPHLLLLGIVWPLLIVVLARRFSAREDDPEQEGKRAGPWRKPTR